MTRDKASLATQIRQAKLRVFELEEEYATQLYVETMPEHDPLYKYCYATSCMQIPHEHQSVDAWIRAIIKHMGRRCIGHGGGRTDALIVSVLQLNSEKAIDSWADYVMSTLRKKARRIRPVESQ